MMIAGSESRSTHSPAVARKNCDSCSARPPDDGAPPSSVGLSQPPPRSGSKGPRRRRHLLRSRRAVSIVGLFCSSHRLTFFRESPSFRRGTCPNNKKKNLPAVDLFRVAGPGLSRGPVAGVSPMIPPCELRSRNSSAIPVLAASRSAIHALAGAYLHLFATNRDLPSVAVVPRHHFPEQTSA